MDECRETESARRNGVREASVFDYAQVVVRHWKWILLVCVPAVAGAAAWSLVLTETYQARTSIVPPLDSMQGANMGLTRGFLGGAEGAFLRHALSVTSVADVYVGILESRTTGEAIVDQFDLTEVYGQGQPRWRTLRQLRSNTDIRVAKEGIVRISVVDSDPARAAAIANAYVEKLDEQNKRLSGGRATSKRIFLEMQLEEMERKLSQAENIPSREEQVQEILYELLIRELLIAKIEEAKSMPTIQVLDTATPPEHKYKPIRRLIVMKAGVGAFAIAVLLAFFRDYRDKTKDRDLAPRCSDRVGAGSLADATDEVVSDRPKPAPVSCGDGV